MNCEEPVRDSRDVTVQDTEMSVRRAGLTRLWESSDSPQSGQGQGSFIIVIIIRL